MLTKRQKQVLDFIKSFTKKRGYSPSLEEIRRYLRLSSISTAHFHVKKLERLGYLRKEKNKPRAIDIFKKEQMVKIPILGVIAAGQPIEAIEDGEEAIAVPKPKLPKTGDFYALRVTGKSMIDENIDDGDIVIIKNQPEAYNGQRIVALIDNDEATLKKFYKEKNKIRLQPANPEMEPIVIHPSRLLIQGIVVDVIKSPERKTERARPVIRRVKKNEEKEKRKALKKWLNTIQCIDCIEGMKKLPDETVNLVIADPPYWKVSNESWDYQWRTIQDYIDWSKKWIKQVSRIIKKNGVFYLFGYFRVLSYLIPVIEALGFELRQQIIIDKGIRSVSGRATKNYKLFPNVTESILYFVFNNKPYIKKFLKSLQKEKGLTAKEINRKLGARDNGGGLWSLYTGNNILAQVPTKSNWTKLQKILGFNKPYSEIAYVFHSQMGLTNVWREVDFYKEKRFHPTQKPVRLIEKLIKASSNKEMLVLDPFMGSGSTAIACKKLGRKFIGFEIDPKYVKIADKRLRDKTNFVEQKTIL